MILASGFRETGPEGAKLEQQVLEAARAGGVRIIGPNTSGMFNLHKNVNLLDLRNIKTTLGMEQLGCQTPAMAVKEIWVYLLAYNLIRRTMLRAALQAQVIPRQLSFKHSLQLCLVWQQYALDTAVEVHPALLILIAGKRVGNRPRRMEPRAIKRRPKSFPLLNQPRSIARKALRNVKGNCALSA